MPRSTRNSKLRTQNSDERIAAALRQAALALAEAIPGKVEAAPLNQVSSALSTVLDELRQLESPHDANQEQVIRWEFVYDGAVRDAPPWAANGYGAPGPFPGAGVRSALGQDRTGQGSDA